jgi:hypothetical protein
MLLTVPVNNIPVKTHQLIDLITAEEFYSTGACTKKLFTAVIVAVS